MMKRVSDAAASFAGTLKAKAGAFTGKAKGKAKTADAEAGSAQASGGATTARSESILASPLLFRSVVGALVLMGAVQWGLIVFNYWR
ncbi:MAG: hypothetical protein AAFP17_07230 [Pseudomonadota bacterium]